MREANAVIRLNEDEVRTLSGWTRSGEGEHRLVERAKIILLAHQGKTNQQIASQLQTRTARVSKWRQRFRKHGVEGLSDAARPGKPAKYDEETEKRVLALLDEPPPNGYSAWHGNRVAERLGNVSKDQVWRILRRRGICLRRGKRPHCS